MYLYITKVFHTNSSKKGSQQEKDDGTFKDLTYTSEFAIFIYLDCQ